MKKSTQIVLLLLLVIFLSCVCVVGLRCSRTWRAEQGLTFDAIFSQRSNESDPRVKELDVALKRAKTERQKIKDVLVKRSQEAQDSLVNLAQAFKEFDRSERESIKKDFNSGKLSPQYENRADVAKAFVLFQEARALKKDENSLHSLYDRFDVAITRAESERANILRYAETSKLLGVEDQKEANEQHSELIDRLTALTDETVNSNVVEDVVLTPDDLESLPDISDDELLSSVVDASNSTEDVATFLRGAENIAGFKAEANSETAPQKENPILDALKSILAAIIWGGLTSVIIFLIGLYFLICPVRNVPATPTTPGNAPAAQKSLKNPFGSVVGLIIFIVLAFYGLHIAGLSGALGLGFIGLLVWRSSKLVREYGVFRFILLALMASFVVFLILVGLAIL